MELQQCPPNLLKECATVRNRCQRPQRHSIQYYKPRIQESKWIVWKSDHPVIVQKCSHNISNCLWLTNQRHKVKPLIWCRQLILPAVFPSIGTCCLSEHEGDLSAGPQIGQIHWMKRERKRECVQGILMEFPLCCISETNGHSLQSNHLSKVSNQIWKARKGVS